MKLNKQRFAKEWLIFIGCILFGIFILPIIFYFFFVDEYTLSKMYGELFMAIFDGEGGVYLFILSPYILIQFIRSTIWSIKIISSKNN